MDEPWAYYIEWSKSEREKQISYFNAYLCNLERQYWWTYLQGSNGDADIENRLVDTVHEGYGGTNRESRIKAHILPYVKQPMGICCVMQAAQPSALWLSRGVGCGGRWEAGSRGRGYMYTCGSFMLTYGWNQHNNVK